MNPRLVLAVLIIGTALCIVMAVQASAHSWYSGKTDPETGISCCGGFDCAEIPDADVREVRGGYEYLPTGEFIPTSRVQQSHDWRFHRCVFLGGLLKGTTRCFFSPPGSM